MTARLEMATPEAFVDCRGRESEALKLPPAIASRWTELRSGWMRWLARRRLEGSIAHLDDRRLADVGLGPQDLGFAERLMRRHAVGGGNWTVAKMASSERRDRVIIETPCW